MVSSVPITSMVFVIVLPAMTLHSFPPIRAFVTCRSKHPTPSIPGAVVGPSREHPLEAPDSKSTTIKFSDSLPALPGDHLTLRIIDVAPQGFQIYRILKPGQIIGPLGVQHIPPKIIVFDFWNPALFQSIRNLQNEYPFELHKYQMIDHQPLFLSLPTDANP